MSSPRDVAKALAQAVTIGQIYDDDTRNLPTWTYLRGLTLSEVLGGYIELRKPKYYGRRRLQGVESVTEAVDTLVLPQTNETIIRALADVAARYPHVALAVTNEVIIANLACRDMIAERCLGLLTRDVHEIVRIKVGCTRTPYLRNHIGDADLSASACDLALTMADEWDGTYDTLIDTVRLLDNSFVTVSQQ
jgi:hypothetical protein